MWLEGGPFLLGRLRDNGEWDVYQQGFPTKEAALAVAREQGIEDKCSVIDVREMQKPVDGTGRVASIKEWFKKPGNA
jgi:hypothetical protein